MIIKLIPVKFQQMPCMDPERRYFGCEVDCHLTSPHFMGGNLVNTKPKLGDWILGANSISED
jgi:hypothetical protein